MFSRAVLAGALGACIASAAAAQDTVLSANRFECAVAEQNVCVMGGGCTATTEPVFLVLDVAAQTYSRCWPGQPCQTAKALFALASGHLQVTDPEHGAMLRMQPRGGFVDVVTQGRDVAVSFGYCRPAD